MPSCSFVMLKFIREPIFITAHASCSSCPSWLLSFRSEQRFTKASFHHERHEEHNRFTTKDTQGTKKHSEGEMLDAIFQLCHVEVHP